MIGLPPTLPTPAIVPLDLIGHFDRALAGPELREKDRHTTNF